MARTLISVVHVRAFTPSSLLPLSKSKMATVENKVHSRERIHACRSLDATRGQNVLRKRRMENHSGIFNTSINLINYPNFLSLGVIGVAQLCNKINGK